ncbi:hypothetical protein PF005_g16469 [Phytophthora fragariae]|uniref:RxLR effector protein n=2 Tax=Phytophthora TaxID=4783 RepID=A0A6A3X8W2_9STRA|nr:hypothetical protein PF003_g33794 [Phytophthora fragariae]KAE9042929.1 hypothetical protein PR002_g3624 [Phytophthora rubi]KAE8946302.1 hypothetical protein PF009_g4069 [Phytophthora fragariae]KAE9029277.1 hypothetical protein PF011_g1155 [Phytophthora fragariae]KAE9049230.1 hypothetical protein PR001_g3519 [Phytophthora rubi]
MKLTAFLVTFLAVAGSTQAGNPSNVAQNSASQSDHADVVGATPAPTTFADVPTPAPTNFSDPTPAPTYPTAAPTVSADLAPTPAPTTTSGSEDTTQSERESTGIVGVAYSTSGAVGVAYATTRAEYEASKSSESGSGNALVVPLAVVGCLLAVLGAVAAVVIMRKRKAAVEEAEIDYSDAIRTPAA